MAVNKVPVLKRCRSLGLEPSYLGYDKKSRRNTYASTATVARPEMCVAICAPIFAFCSISLGIIVNN